MKGARIRDPLRELFRASSDGGRLRRGELPEPVACAGVDQPQLLQPDCQRGRRDLQVAGERGEPVLGEAGSPRRFRSTSSGIRNADAKLFARISLGSFACARS